MLIDKGVKQGVHIGNRFLALVHGDPEQPDIDSSKELKPFPVENVGEIMVIFTYPNHSVGIVTRSNVELTRGQHIRMLKDY